MSKSNLIAFRLPAEPQALFNSAVSNSGSDKTAWKRHKDITGKLCLNV